jgi:hypothetical protein
VNSETGGADLHELVIEPPGIRNSKAGKPNERPGGEAPLELLDVQCYPMAGHHALRDHGTNSLAVVPEKERGISRDRRHGESERYDEKSSQPAAPPDSMPGTEAIFIPPPAGPSFPEYARPFLRRRV